MKYDDIINLPYHGSKRKSRMSIKERACQFAPFDALEGFSDTIIETSRLTTKRIEISEDLKTKLNEKLNIIDSDKSKEVTITYFIPDKYKSGGKYKSVKSFVKKIDLINNLIILTDKTNIPIKEIIDIKISCF